MLTNPLKTLLSAVVAANLALATPALACKDHAAQAAQSTKTHPLSIQSNGRTYPFTVELASTAEEKQTGLMYRTKLAKDTGMLFVWENDIEAKMWMKNTKIPLDMLFLDANGQIKHIHANAVPDSLDRIGAGQPVRAVLELPGGTAAAKGIKEGDRVIFPGLGS